LGATRILLLLRYRVPVVTAWSTPRAAMLIAGAVGGSMTQAVGASLVSVGLILQVGFACAFARDQENPELPAGEIRRWC
jgi:benzoate membrane transport protein